MLRRNLSWAIIGVGAILCLGAVTVGATGSLVANGHICYGVTIAGVEVGGCTRAEAFRRLQKVIDRRESQAITFALDSRIWKATFHDLGGHIKAYRAVEAAFKIGREGSFFQRWSDRFASGRGHKDIPLEVQYNPARIRLFLKAIARQIDRPARSATLKEVAGGLQILPERSGYRLDIQATTEAALEQAVSDPATSIPLKIVEDQPQIRSADLGGIDTVLASYTTSFHTCERARTHNLTLAAHQVNGKLLRPGEIFSYNETVGPRLEKLGFREAPIFVDGEIIPGTGGGVCQVSTTLYNTVLLAGLKVVARSHHSIPVKYAPKGRDATVSYGGIDFKFENTATHPIYISTQVGRGRLTIRIWGHPDDKKEVELVSSGGKSIIHQVITRPDSSLPVGKRVVARKGRSGYRVTTIRVIRVRDGSKRREVISNDYYRARPTVIRVGTRAPETESAEVPHHPSQPLQTGAKAGDSGGNLASH